MSERLCGFQCPTVAVMDEVPVIRRLGRRLQHLYEWALEAGEFEEVWDLCCDHGRLGLHLHQTYRSLQPPARPRVHLIDRVPKVVNDLELRYWSLKSAHLRILCADAGQIVLPRRRHQLILLAGIGGDTVAAILQPLLRQIEQQGAAGSGNRFDFLISPNSRVFELRHFLRQHPLELVQEEFVEERGWFHEHLHLRYRSDAQSFERVSAAGTRLWQPLTPEKITCLQRVRAHYLARAKLGGDALAQQAADAYSVLLTLK